MTNLIKKTLEKHLNDNHKINFSILEKITNYLDQACKKTISFYQITDKESALKNFVERFEKSKAGLVILLGEYEHPKVVCVSEKDFYNLQISLCDILLPLKRIALIGITGTNGKTSTANFVTSILNQNDYSAVSLGTLGLVYKSKLIHDFKMTTPGYIEIRNAIQMMPEESKVLVMEVSSHGLKQNRLGNLQLDVAGWTNFTQDHLDYHKTMEDYFEAKSLIKKITKSKLIIPNNSQLKDLLDKNKFEYELAKPFEKICSLEANPYFNIEYHRENFELAYALAKEVIDNDIKVDINELDYPEGRFEIYNKNQRMFVIDYAHTPDALEKLLSEIKANFSDKKLKVVFGCGGDRDIQKRGQMGAIASNLADMIYVTDDNPRTEDPKLITKMISEAITNEHKVINDREESIKTAFKESLPGDIIVIAGKGHEKYQEINGKRSYFSDQDIVKSLE